MSEWFSMAAMTGTSTLSPLASVILWPGLPKLQALDQPLCHAGADRDLLVSSALHLDREDAARAVEPEVLHVRVDEFRGSDAGTEGRRCSSDGAHAPSVEEYRQRGKTWRGCLAVREVLGGGPV
jgi:hypothetical protein